MIDIDKEVLMQLSKEQLIYLLEQFEHSACVISETCVDVSKGNINAKDAISEICNNCYTIPDLENANNLKALIDLKCGKISINEYRKAIGMKPKEESVCRLIIEY